MIHDSVLKRDVGHAQNEWTEAAIVQDLQSHIKCNGYNAQEHANDSSRSLHDSPYKFSSSEESLIALREIAWLRPQRRRLQRWMVQGCVYESCWAWFRSAPQGRHDHALASSKENALALGGTEDEHLEALVYPSRILNENCRFRPIFHDYSSVRNDELVQFARWRRRTGLRAGIGLSNLKLPVRFTQSSCNLQVLILGFWFMSSNGMGWANFGSSKLSVEGNCIPIAGRFCKRKWFDEFLDYWRRNHFGCAYSWPGGTRTEAGFVMFFTTTFSADISSGRNVHSCGGVHYNEKKQGQSLSLPQIRFQPASRPPPITLIILFNLHIRIQTVLIQRQRSLAYVIIDDAGKTSLIETEFVLMQATIYKFV